MSKKGGLSENVELIVAIAKGIVRDQHTRRTVLFYVVLTSILMVFVGSVFLDHWLNENPWRFLFYWGACLWLTVLSVLLALQDLMMLRITERRERERLKKQVLGLKSKDDAELEP